LRTDVFRNLELISPQLSVSNFSRGSDGQLLVTVTSDVFAHAVHFTMIDPATEDDFLYSDNYFDLLPKEQRIIVISGPGSELIQKKNIHLSSIY